MSRYSTKLILFLQKATTTCIALQAEQIFSVIIQYMYFSILGVAPAVPFLYYFQKLQPLMVTNFEIIFAALYFCLYELKHCVSEL